MSGRKGHDSHDDLRAVSHFPEIFLSRSRCVPTKRSHIVPSSTKPSIPVEHLLCAETCQGALGGERLGSESSSPSVH